MKQTGEKLRQSREEKGISLEEVVIATKIKMSTLKAMEEGDTKKLPSKTFIRGFVQSYAKYLNADEEDILETFYQEMGSTVDIPNNVKATTEMDNRDDSNAMKFANSTRHPLIKIFFAIGAFILVVLIYFVSTTIDKYQEEKQLVKPTQEEAANIEPLVEEEEVAEIVEPENEELAETAKKEEPPTELKPEPKPEKKAFAFFDLFDPLITNMFVIGNFTFAEKLSSFFLRSPSPKTSNLLNIGTINVV